MAGLGAPAAPLRRRCRSIAASIPRLQEQFDIPADPVSRSGFFVVLDVAVDQVGHVVVAFLFLFQEGVVLGDVVLDLDAVDRDVLLGLLGLDLVERDEFGTGGRVELGVFFLDRARAATGSGRPRTATRLERPCRTSGR